MTFQSDTATECLVLSPDISLQLTSCGALSKGEVVSRDNDRTGIFIWLGARMFCTWLADLLRIVPPSMFGNVIEFGGGIGLGAMAVAALSREKQCLSTDFWEPCLHLSVSQVEVNRSVFERNDSAVTVGKVDWTWFLSPIVTSADVLPIDASPSCNEWRNFDRNTFQCFASQLDIGPGSQGGRHPCWLIGLDVMYPDTRDDVLLGLLSCVHLTLRSRTVDSTVVGVNLFHNFTTTFVERDAGVTLRRILAAATVVGLTVRPLSSPFDSGTISSPFPSATEAFRKSCNSHVESSPSKITAEIWAAFHSTVVRRIDDASISLRVCGSGTWLLDFSLATDCHCGGGERPVTILPLEDLSGFASSPEVTSFVRGGCNHEWVTSLPWLWPPVGDPWIGPFHQVKHCHVAQKLPPYELDVEAASRTACELQKTVDEDGGLLSLDL